jgi:hypothetical protein
MLQNHSVTSPVDTDSTSTCQAQVNKSTHIATLLACRHAINLRGHYNQGLGQQLKVQAAGTSIIAAVRIRANFCKALLATLLTQCKVSLCNKTPQQTCAAALPAYRPAPTPLPPTASLPLALVKPPTAAHALTHEVPGDTN